MKKLSSLIIALFVLSAGTVFAQNVNVTADVLAELNVATTDVSFGNVQQGSAAQVQANTNDIANSNASAPSSGTLDVTAGTQDYQVSVTQDAILTDGDGNNPGENVPYRRYRFFGKLSVSDLHFDNSFKFGDILSKGICQVADKRLVQLLPVHISSVVKPFK